MTIDAAGDVYALHADIVRVWASVTPPLGRAKKSYYRCTRCNCKVSRPCVAADVNFCPSRELVKAFEAWPSQNNLPDRLFFSTVSARASSPGPVATTDIIPYFS
jgi:hypothetical protein